jgi:CubicO group peptidase (beta-lactamase class C family)
MGEAMVTGPRDRASAGSHRELSRRSRLKGVGVAGLATGLAPATSAVAHARPGAEGEWDGFEAAVRAEFERMNMVGAAVAVVSADGVVHASTYGVRDQRRRPRVTSDTHFLVASTTKSMSALFVATYVDDGALAWDQPVIDAWSAFRAPTEELTRTLRVRDLLGMATGIGEPPALSALHEGDPTATQLLQSVVNLPVIGPPGSEWFYNNTVYAVGGYLPLLAQGVPGDQLMAAYATAMQERVYGPVGMHSARIADDPRGVVDDYARGHQIDLFGDVTTLPYGAVGSYAPVGGTLATLTDMAAYVRLQLRRGVAVDGGRVVSAANLAECWKPHISVPVSPDLDPDTVRSGYAMGWITQTFRDGTTFTWHNGGIDGFITLIGFLPERDLGLVVLNSMNPGPTGPLFYLYVLNLLLSERFGLNVGVPAQVDAAYEQAVRDLTALGDQAEPVDRDAVAPYEGHYEGGYEVHLHGRDLLVRLGSRVLPLLAMPDGGYIISDSLLVGVRVNLTRDADGTPRMELVGLETVRRTVGFD